MAGARLDYDNAAFYHFFIAVLFIFLAPFSFFAIKRIVSFLILRSRPFEMKDKARTKEEQEKFEKSKMLLDFYYNKRYTRKNKATVTVTKRIKNVTYFVAWWLCLKHPTLKYLGCMFSSNKTNN